MNAKRAAQVMSAVSVLLPSAQVFAAGSSMPWEGPLMRIMDSCTGPVAMVLGTLVIVGTGLSIAFGEGGGFLRKALCVVFGLSICFTAGSFMLNFFGYGGGVSFGA